MRRDELGEELITDDIAKREIAMDKEFIRLVQIACKKDNIPRAIEVSKLLHHTVSFDMAIKVADFYHLAGLREKIETLKAQREQEDRLAIARDKRRQWAKPDRPLSLIPTVNDSVPPPPRPLQDYSKPPTISRPGLARVVPSIEHTRYSSAALPANVAGSTSSRNSMSPEGKRKRGDAEESGVDEIPKRRAMDGFALPQKPAGERLWCPQPVIVLTESQQQPILLRGNLTTRIPLLARWNRTKSSKRAKASSTKSTLLDLNLLERNVHSFVLCPLSILIYYYVYPLGDGVKGKEKEKKEATRQTTLFGLVPGPTGDKKSRNKKKVTESQEPEKDDGVGESQDASTQDTDVSMTNVDQSLGDATLVETQPDEWQEPSQTHAQIESQGQVVDSPQEVRFRLRFHVDNINDPRGLPQKAPSPEPIEWPPSPPAQSRLNDLSQEVRNQ